MGVRGPQPSPNARRNGAKVYISPAHADKLDEIRGSQSKADWLEQTIDEYWNRVMYTFGTQPPEQTDAELTGAYRRMISLPESNRGTRYHEEMNAIIEEMAKRGIRP
jgi:hypothetical protein